MKVDSQVNTEIVEADVAVVGSGLQSCAIALESSLKGLKTVQIATESSGYIDPYSTINTTSLFTDLLNWNLIHFYSGLKHLKQLWQTYPQAFLTSHVEVKPPSNSLKRKLSIYFFNLYLRQLLGIHTQIDKDKIYCLRIDAKQLENILEAKFIQADGRFFQESVLNSIDRNSNYWKVVFSQGQKSTKTLITKMIVNCEQSEVCNPLAKLLSSSSRCKTTLVKLLELVPSHPLFDQDVLLLSKTGNHLLNTKNSAGEAVLGPAIVPNITEKSETHQNDGKQFFAYAKTLLREHGLKTELKRVDTFSIPTISSPGKPNSHYFGEMYFDLEQQYNKAPALSVLGLDPLAFKIHAMQIARLIKSTLS